MTSMLLSDWLLRARYKYAGSCRDVHSGIWAY